MMPIRSVMAILFTAPMLGSCIGHEPPPYTSADSEARLGQRLAGRVAGPPIDCLPTYSSGNMEVIDADTILFGAGSLIYRQDTTGYCYPTGRQSNYVLVTSDPTSGGRLCNGETARIVDSSSGFVAGSCTFNAFVPFRRP